MNSEKQRPDADLVTNADENVDGVHPRAVDYLQSGGSDGERKWLPLAGFLVLCAVTLVAFLVVGPPVRPQAASAGPSMPAGQAAPGGQQREMPVSMSYDEQLATLEAALEVDPRDTAALSALSELMLAAHQPERAIELLDEWLAISPDSPDALLQKVMTYAALQRWDEAIEVNQALYDMEPERLLTRINMGALYANRGDVDAARAWWTDLIADAPESNEATAARRAIAQLDSQQETGSG